MAEIKERFGYEEVVRFDPAEYEKVDKDNRVLEFDVPEYSDMDSVLFQIKYYYRKFQEQDCSANYKEFRKLIDELNAICAVRDRLRDLYDKH